MNPNANYGPRVIMLYQYSFILGNICTILESDVDNGELYAYTGAGVICKISLPFSQFCRESKTSLKIIKTNQQTNDTHTHKRYAYCNLGVVDLI